MALVHSSDWKPRIFPINADVTDAEIDRLQSLSKSISFNRTKIEEVGRAGVVDWKDSVPTNTLTLRQLEYGSLEFYRKLANKGDSVSTINFTDFKSAYVDIAAYETDDAGTFLGTVYWPSYRLSGFSLNIGDPQALAERSFTLVGEDEKTLENNNKYLINKRLIITSTGLNRTVTISDPTPIADPDNSGRFLFRVVKVSGGTATELSAGLDWSYNGVDTLTINGSSTSGDVVLVWYSAGSYISGGSYFTANDADLSGINADSCDIFIASSSRVARIQSISLDATFDRFDVREVGNKDTVARGIRDTTARVTLGRILENYTIEEFLRNVNGQSYGILDIRKFIDELSLVVKIYSDNTKTTFKMGYKITDLAPSGLDSEATPNDYIQQGVTLEGETGFVTTVNAVL